MRLRSIRLLLVLTVILTFALGFAAPLHAQTATFDLDGALKWMGTLQNADGGFSDGFNPGSSLNVTADAIVAISSAGEDITTFNKGGNTPLTYLQAQVQGGKVVTVTQWGKVLDAVRESGDDIHNFAGIDLSAKTIDVLSKSLDGKDILGEAIAVRALADSDIDVPQPAIDSLLKSQNKDGGWGTAAGQPSDTNTTAIAMEALVDLQPVGKYRVVAPTLAYFKATQNPDGGWPFQKPGSNTASDCNSTAQVVSALYAAGEDMSDWNNPDVFLAKFQQKDGSFTSQLTSPAPNFTATVAAIPPLSVDLSADLTTPGQ